MASTADQLVGKNTNQRAVFANNELSLRHTQVYGFDFDFTLIDYTEEVLKYIYESSRNRLVDGLSVCPSAFSLLLLLLLHAFHSTLLV